MNFDTQLDARSASDEAAAEAFKGWVRRVVKGAAELRALNDGQLDAIIDPATGNAVMLPEAQVALHDSQRIVHSAFDALPGGVCVLDRTGTVVLTNKAWRAFSAAFAGAGLGVREGDNFIVACRTAEKDEHAHAQAVAAGLRQVIIGTRSQFRREYVCRSPQGECVFTLNIAGPAGNSEEHVVIARENVRERRRIRAPLGKMHAARGRIAARARPVTPNHLLAALPASEYERLVANLEPVTLTYGDILYEPGQRMRQVYFPGDSLVSLLTIVDRGRSLEVGLVGHEGMIGARLAMGITESPVRALVQQTGSAMRLSASHFVKALRHCAALQRVVIQFAGALLSQISQTAACNCFHVVDQRLARWLLMTCDRLPSSEFQLTQEFLADMLGVRRVGVTTAASALQRRKLIRYRRGHIKIIDRAGLEAAACSCYGRVRTMNFAAISA